MRRGLIGYTGFVGSNLDQQRRFEDHYNSSNFTEMLDQEYDVLICAGVKSVKWLANKNPNEDAADIQKLIDVLATVKAREFILISTIDVYPNPDCDDNEDASIDGDGLHAYGLNRLKLEKWATEHFQNCRILRLPALFGPGLKKNALYDLLHDNQVDRVNPAGNFQWYPVARLGQDIEIARQHDLSLVNLFPEPIAMSDILKVHFADAAVTPASDPAPNYRLRTKHAEIFGGSDGFIMNGENCHKAISGFIYEERPRHGA